MRVLLVEDQEFNRYIITHRFSNHPGWTIAGEASDVEGANRWLDQFRADFLLVDIGLPPPGDGFSVVAHAQKIQPHIRVLVLTAHLNEYIISRCEHYHVHGFFNKNQAAVGSIEPMLETLAAGGRYFPAEYIKVRQLWLENGRAISGRLSEREMEVLHLIALGRSDEEIGDALTIQPSTAATHKGAILRKLNQPNIAKLTVFAINHGYGQLSY